MHKKRKKDECLTSTNQSSHHHATTENYIIDWEGAKIIDKEPNKRSRQVKKVIWIRKTKTLMNRDEGNFELHRVYDDVIRH